jgi:hypothetical protein
MPHNPLECTVYLFAEQGPRQNGFQDSQRRGGSRCFRGGTVTMGFASLFREAADAHPKSGLQGRLESDWPQLARLRVSKSRAVFARVCFAFSQRACLDEHTRPVFRVMTHRRAVHYSLRETKAGQTGGNRLNGIKRPSKGEFRIIPRCNTCSSCGQSRASSLSRCQASNIVGPLSHHPSKRKLEPLLLTSLP